MRRDLLRLPFSLAAGLMLFTQAVSSTDWAPPFHHLSRPMVQLAPPRPWIAFTFDDGPHPKMTERLLALLDKEKIPATFFVVGKMADRYPYLVQEISAAGHEVSNHSYNHVRFSGLTPQEVLSELSRTREVIRRLTGKDNCFYRPPGGGFSQTVLRAASHAGYRMVLWSTLTKDVEGASTAKISQRILSGAQDGGIILMHSGIPNTLDALPDVITALRARGYQFVTVSTLLNRSSVKPAVAPAPQVQWHFAAQRRAPLSFD